MRLDLPLMSERVKFSVELSHGDGLGIENVGVHNLKWDTTGSALALQSCQSVSQNLKSL